MKNATSKNLLVAILLAMLCGCEHNLEEDDLVACSQTGATHRKDTLCAHVRRANPVRDDNLGAPITAGAHPGVPIAVLRHDCSTERHGLRTRHGSLQQKDRSHEH